jgi:NAD(P)-dependent dehydrogenase (short-subunit alcohol dehydrogenase family)
LFPGDASYILVGGLGGIGRALALWMSDHGAKHMIFVNRSGMSGEPAQATVRKLRTKNITVAVYACDISNQSEVARMFVDISETQLPVRGLIHGAMVLKVPTIPSPKSPGVLTTARISTLKE